MHPRTHKQRGAALIVGLMMLVVVTLLAVTAVSTSSTELIMAGNEQFRERAFQAAEAGVETAYRKVRSGDADVPINRGTHLDNNNVALTYDNRDAVSTRIDSYGAGPPPDGNSKFMAQIFRISSTGTSVRNSRSLHEAGVWVLSPYDEANKGQQEGSIGDSPTDTYGAL